MTSNPSNRLLFAFILSASLASTIGGLPFNVLPVMLGSLADSFKLDAQTTGLIGSICFAGYLVGTLGAPFWMNRVNWRVLTIVSAVGTAASFALSSQVSTLELLFVVWALIGFFASTMTCLGMRILSDLPDKVRAFGTRQGVELSVTAAVLFALPPLIISEYKYPGAALSLAAVVAVLGLSAFWVPTGAQTNEEASPGAAATGAYLPAAAWQSLGLFFIFLVGNIGLWAFLERIGSSLQIAPAEMGIVFAVLKLLGGVAAFFTAAVGERVGPTRAAWWVVGAVGAGLILLQTASAFIGFALGAWIWEFAFTCGCVFHAASIARSDASGRAVMLVPAVFALSSMAGPGLAGQIVANGNYLGLLAFALASTLLPALVNIVRKPA
jgi:predicted MFS family arabinose efflux permease